MSWGLFANPDEEEQPRKRMTMSYEEEDMIGDIDKWCSICDERIREDSKYYDFDGEIVCEDCIDDYLEEHSNYM